MVNHHNNIHTNQPATPAAAATTKNAAYTGISLPAVAPFQKKEATGGLEATPQLKTNNTGLPDNLKTGIEQLSGFSMNDVKVHYNSARPAQLQALAYAQGTDIHVAPGQEKHLPHEAWHVVQQKKGIVKPTLQMKGEININDDKALEQEADTMGSKVMGMIPTPGDDSNTTQLVGAHTSTIQRKVGFEIEVLGQAIKEKRDTDLNYRALTKGEVLHQGDGWKLTPDNKEGRLWTPEYIVAAIDETTNPKDITDKVTAVATHAQEHLEDTSTWSAGANISTEENYEEILGNFHVTGGLRLSRISELIKVLYPAADKEDATTDEALANRAEAITYSGTNYKSVVALVALQISDLVKSPVNARLNGQSGKRAVSILSRTDLGVVVAKVTKLTSRATFIAEVLAVANVKADTKLFNNQLPGAAATGRDIDDQQDLTVGQWLDKLLTGNDFTWSETKSDAGGAFGYDKVGPAGMLGGRADGVVLELRGLQEQGNYSPRVADWPKVAARYTRLFSLLNAKKSHQEVTQGFGNYGD